MRYRDRYPRDIDIGTNRAKREANFFRVPLRASRRSPNILDYLREPPGKANFFYTTSAGLPAAPSFLFLPEVEPRSFSAGGSYMAARDRLLWFIKRHSFETTRALKLPLLGKMEIESI